MEDTIYQIKIELLEFEPTIWRRVLLNSDTSLFGLHSIIQITMGWENAHLFHFKKGKEFFDDDEIDLDEIPVSDLLPKTKSKIIDQQ